MKKYFVGIFCILFCSIFFVNAEEKVIVFETDNSPPYTISSGKEGELQGFMVDIARYIYEKAGYKIQIKFAPYARSLHDVQNGAIDGMLLVAEVTAPGLVFLQNPISTEKIGFFVKKGSTWKYNGIQSLEKMKIGSGLGYDFADADINEYIKKKVAEKSPLVDLVSGSDVNLTNFKKLLAGRIDIVIATENIGLYVAAQNNLSQQIEIAGYSKSNIIAQTGFNPKNPNAVLYADILSKGVLEMTKSGQLKKMKAKYGLIN